MAALAIDTDALAELADMVALRVLELLDERGAGARPHDRLVDVAELAEILNVSRDTVYRHSATLGAVRIGDGPRPALRFDVEKATAAWTARCASVPPLEPAPRAGAGRTPGRPRRVAGTGADLLPIRGEVLT